MSLTQINKAGLDEIALDHVFTIGASGSSAYTFQGEGLNGTVNNPTLYLTRGKTYRFENGTGGHPIRIQSTSGASGTAYNTGVTNNAQAGTVIVEVQHDAPDILYYQCTSHAAMNGILYITGALADGGVTTAKIANNAVTTAKLADDAVTNAKLGASAVGTTEIATNAVTSDKINTGQVTTAKLGDLAVSTAKLGNDAVTSAKIADNTIISGNLANSAITTAKIATGAVTGVKIAAEIDNSHITATANIAGSKLADGGISTAKIADGAVNAVKLADSAVPESKLNVSNSPTNGYFLSAQSGATGGMTWAQVNTDISGNLDGDIQSNGHDIHMGDSSGTTDDRLFFGAGDDASIYHDSNDTFFKHTGVGGLRIDANDLVLRNGNGSHHYVECDSGYAVQLFENGNKKFETTNYGTLVTGYQSSTSYIGFHVRLDGNNNGFGTDHGSGITTYNVDYYSPIPMFNSRTVNSGNSYLQFPSYASGEYIKFTAPVAGVYMFELMCSWETHAGNDWLAVGWEKNTTTANSSGSLSGNGQYASGVFQRTSVDSGGPSNLQTIMWMDSNDYAVLYQQSCSAVRFGANEAYVRGTLIH